MIGLCTVSHMSIYQNRAFHSACVYLLCGSPLMQMEAAGRREDVDEALSSTVEASCETDVVLKTLEVAVVGREKNVKRPLPGILKAFCDAQEVLTSS